ncbi:MAG: oxygenase MpaB family protein [Mycobacterium sp.]|uniref:oxygenase MpaB family protein n=1 Tax=Mycobacterium sp. TaxID=1785 RepID=UPI003C915850
MSVEPVDVPVTVEAPTPSATTLCPVHDNSVHAAGSSVGDRFQEVAGSKFVAMFAPALFDEMMHPAVSASLVDTARIRDNPLGRARRTAASDQLAFFAHSPDRAAEMQRLVELHRDVKGIQPDGLRYSAMNPEPWNWNLYSIFFMHRGVFMTLTGEKLTAAQNQEIWDRYRTMTAGLQMPGRARQLIENYDEMCAHYDRIVAEVLTHTEALDIVMDATLHPKRPEHWSRAWEPVISLVGPLAGRLVTVLGFGIMHPGVRAMVPMRWTRRHDLAFSVLSRVLRVAYRRLPRRLTDTPLTRNRREYERIIARYKSIELPSFTPGTVSPCGR